MARTDRHLAARAALTMIALFTMTRCTSFSSLHGAPEGDGGETHSSKHADGGGGLSEAGHVDEGGSANDGDAGCAATETYQSIVLKDKPLAYWRFEESGRATPAFDATGGARTCTFGAGVTFGASARDGCSRGIDLVKPAGDRGLRCDGSFGFAAKKAFTFEAWILPRSVDADKSGYVISNATTSPRTGYELYVGTGSDGPRVVLELYNQGTFLCGAKAPFSMSKWTYVVASYDGTSVTVASATPGEVALVSESDVCEGSGVVPAMDGLEIGAAADRSDDFFDGKIDDVAVYDHVLTRASIDARLDVH